jgi:uncharacterized protein
MTGRPSRRLRSWGEIAAAGPFFLVSSRPPARRFRKLPIVVAQGRRVPVADAPRARLLGLAFLRRERAGAGLLIPGCRSVHTFGMRFALDLVFLDGEGRPLAVRRDVPPRRLATERRAAAVLELPAGSLSSKVVAAKSSRAGGESSSPLP